MEEQPGLIELDLPRTFPKLSLFNEEGTLVVVVVVIFISTPLLDVDSRAQQALAKEVAHEALAQALDVHSLLGGKVHDLGDGHFGAARLAAVEINVLAHQRNASLARTARHLGELINAAVFILGNDATDLGDDVSSLLNSHHVSLECVAQE